MKETRISFRYAKSLLDLAEEQKQTELVKADMEFILSAIKGSRELARLLSSPIVPTEKKKAALTEIFSGAVSSLTLSFIQILTDKKRETYLKEIAQQFIDQYKVVRQITTAVVTTAVPLDEDLRNKIRAMVAKRDGNGKVDLIEKIDPSLIGGFVLKIGDRQIDQSISGKLNEFKRSLVTNAYQKESFLN